MHDDVCVCEYAFETHDDVLFSCLLLRDCVDVSNISWYFRKKGGHFYFYNVLLKGTVV